MFLVHVNVCTHCFIFRLLPIWLKLQFENRRPLSATERAQKKGQRASGKGRRPASQPASQRTRPASQLTPLNPPTRS